MRVALFLLSIFLTLGCICGSTPETENFTEETSLHETSSIVPHTTSFDGNPTSTSLAEPKNKIDCEALGGRWGRMGLYPEEICNLKTKDGGRICMDSSECEGICIAELTPEERKKAQNSKIKATGKCSEYMKKAGC
ncbi:MAG: hypothetical protein KKD39_05055, partial [Candidatus Altiarchaeota archaeon]|nr:hypothetical protein [Candidatus Altiarchaeota archaeon]